MTEETDSVNITPGAPRTTARRWIVLITLLVLGFGLRLIDLTDPPLDFHPTRQLRAAIIARGMYYEMTPDADPILSAKAMQLRATLESYEPQIFERLTALSYLVIGSETLWTARLFAILFWCLGGVFLFDLARRMVSWDGGLVALAFYLLLPLAIDASRSFQPDPLVTLWIIVSLWTTYRWNQRRTWHWALATGIVVGLTLLIKPTAVFFLAPAVTLLVLNIWGLRMVFRRWEVWVAFILVVLIPGSFYVAQKGQSAMNYIGFWTGSFYNLWMEPAFYVQWLKTLDRLFNLALLVAGLASVALFPTRGQRNAIFGMWLGYGVYGLYFPFQIRTHEYYSLMFVPVVALSLAPLGQQLIHTIRPRPLFWRAVATAAVLVGAAYPVWITYTGLIGVDYATEAAAWTNMGEQLPQDGQIIALTHDYGYRLGYYGWRHVQVWPNTDEQDMLAQRVSSNSGSDEEFEQEFITRTQGMDYFLITRFDQLEAQPLLKDYLYTHYLIAATGDGYLLFNLRAPTP